MSKHVLLALLIGATPMSIGAQSLSTIFAADNAGALGGAVYFDLTVGANPINVTGFTTNTSTSQTGSFGWTVYTILGGSSGVQTNQGLWTQVATGSGVAAGFDNISVVTLNNSFSLFANTFYGMALVMGPEAEHLYTNGTGTNQQYSNSDLTLDFGSVTNAPFTGEVFNPRVWNGSIEYTTGTEVVPEPATMTLLATGLAGMAAARRRKRNA